MPEGDPQDTLLTQETTSGETLLDTQPKEESGQSTEGEVQAPEWITENLKDDLQTSKSLAKFPSVAELAKGYVNLERRVGDSARIPGPNATADELSKFYGKLGRPETPDGYELTSTLPEVDGEANAYKQNAHKLGLSKVQAEALWNMSQQMTTKMIAKVRGQLEQNRAKSVETLKADWADEYDTKLAGASKIAKRFGGDDYMRLMKETRMGDNPIQIRFLANIDKAISEDTLEGGSSAIPESTGWTYPKSPELNP